MRIETYVGEQHTCIGYTVTKDLGPWAEFSICLDTDNTCMAVGPWDWRGGAGNASILPFFFVIKSEFGMARGGRK